MEAEENRAKIERPRLRKLLPPVKQLTAKWRRMGYLWCSFSRCSVPRNTKIKTHAAPFVILGPGGASNFEVAGLLSSGYNVGAPSTTEQIS